MIMMIIITMIMMIMMGCLAFRYSGQVSLRTIGTSSEGRSLKLIKIGDRSDFLGTKKDVWIDCGIHARWVY